MMKLLQLYLILRGFGFIVACVCVCSWLGIESWPKVVWLL